LEILYLDKINSTQKYLVEKIKKEDLKKEIAIVAKEQTNGVGSRNNTWISDIGDLIFSFAIKKSSLPQDLPISSASIYFGFLLKEVLKSYNKNCFLKWPNDIYLYDSKAGGIITQIIKDFYVVGVGVNLTEKAKDYAYFGNITDVNKLLESYFLLLKKAPNWQEVFSKFRLEFKKQKTLYTTINGRKKLLKDAVLCEDGSLLVDNERIYSLR
jgi:BirA family biotin operon repressor/biotin-[acetyl-CoA-carboxylase] ligase